MKIPTDLWLNVMKYMGLGSLTLATLGLVGLLAILAFAPTCPDGGEMPWVCAHTNNPTCP